MTSDLHNVLYDHYKETFAYIRERERQRDRLFILVAVLLAIHVLILRYASALPEIAADVSIFGLTVAVQRIPLPAVVSLSWTLLTVITLRYLQVTVHIDRQYDYLHPLEEQLSKALGEEAIISREGRAYYSARGSILRHTAWAFYLGIFPAALIAASLTAGFTEWQSHLIPLGHKLYDTTVGLMLASILAVFVIDIWWRRAGSN